MEITIKPVLKLDIQLDIEPVYYRIEFSKSGKSFPCLVKFIPGDRHWICIYLNKDNLNDFFVRKEVISETLLQHGERTYEEVYNHMFNKIQKLLGVGI